MLKKSVEEAKGGYTRLKEKGQDLQKWKDLDLQWEERLGVRFAQRLAWEDNSSEVTEEYLLLGVLTKEESGHTVQELRELLGKDNMDELVKVIYASLGKTPRIGTADFLKGLRK